MVTRIFRIFPYNHYNFFLNFKKILFGYSQTKWEVNLPEKNVFGKNKFGFDYFPIKFLKIVILKKMS